MIPIGLDLDNVKINKSIKNWIKLDKTSKMCYYKIIL